MLPAIYCAAFFLSCIVAAAQENNGDAGVLHDPAAGRRYSVTERRSIEWKHQLPMSISESSGIIYIRGGKRDDIKIKAIKTARHHDLITARKLAREIDLMVEAPMERIIVSSNTGGPLFEGHTAFIDYSILTPAGISLDIETEDGPVDVAGIDGGVEIQTASGTIQLKNIKGESLVTSERGGISIENCPGLSFAETGGAGISYDIDDKIVSPSLVLITNGGDVEFTYPGEQAVSFEVRAGEGEVDVEGTKLEEKKDIQLDGITGEFVEAAFYVHGSGEPVKITITTNGGAVTIRNTIPPPHGISGQGRRR